MITIRDVANRARVSTSTVSHVINETRYVSEELRTRVLQAMEELNYQPNALARSLRRKITHIFGAIVPDSSNPFFAEMARHLEDAAFAEGYSLILCNSDDNLEKERRYIEVLVEKRVDGIVFLAAGESASQIHALRAQDIPFVVVDRELLAIEGDMVLTDHEQGGYLATSHLIELGHTRIAHISGPADLRPSELRLAGYRRALQEADIPFDPALVARGDFHFGGGYEAARALLALAAEQRPTAIFAGNDMMAIGAMRAAREAHLVVPDDLSIVGFDDVSVGQYLNPPLTTIAQPRQELARRAIQFLIDRVTERDLAPRRETLPTTLTRRDSSGPPGTRL